MTSCAFCDKAPATTERDIAGVDYELCASCADALDHPSPETIVRELAKMSRRHHETAEAAERM